MCRWLAYKGRPIVVSHLVSDPNNSLVRQTLSLEGFMPLEHAPRHPVDGDGFGLGWYDLSISPEPARLVFADPAWSNPNLQNLAHLLRTELLFAHVRAASPHSHVSISNCHPFKYGNWLFMHNGNLSGFPQMRRRIYDRLPDPIFNSISGTTDSEHCFALLLSMLPSLDTPLYPFELRDTVAALINLLMEWACELGISEKISLNFAVADGYSMVATRFSSHKVEHQQQAQSLYYAEADHFELSEDGSLQCLRNEEGSRGAVIISSEPLTVDWSQPDECPNWIPVPEDSIITVTPDLAIHVEQLDITKRPVQPSSTPQATAAGRTQTGF
jgi:glutamine amidotransferase